MGRVVLSILFMLAALVCGCLLLAGFEYPGVTAWKVVTGTLCVLFFALALAIAWKRRPR